MFDVRFRIESVKLPDGWSGSVLTGEPSTLRSTGRKPGDSVHGLAPVALKPAAQWQPVLSQLVSNREALPDYTLLKYSNDGEVFRAQLPVGNQPISVVVKQCLMGGLSQRLVRTLIPARGVRNFDRALALLRAGINTACPLALMERRSPRREAWLITEFVPDLADLDQVALRLLPQLELAHRRKIKDAIIDAIVGLFDTLERHHLAHRDLKASNILLKNWNGKSGPVSVWLVDLDGLQRRKPFSTIKRWQPLVRLAASLLSYTNVTRTDYVRFLQAYLARTGIPRKAWRLHFRKLVRKANDYVRRSQRRKSHKLDGYLGE